MASSACVLLSSPALLQAIHAHTSSLQEWTYAALRQLRHSNGKPLVQLFGRHSDPSRQSCIFQFLVLQPDGAATSQVWRSCGVSCTELQCLRLMPICNIHACKQLCLHAQPCMQGSGDAACLLCMLGAVYLHMLAPRLWPILALSQPPTLTRAATRARDTRVSMIANSSRRGRGVTCTPLVDFWYVLQVVVEEAAFDAGLAIRTGCMCNPGQCHFNLGIQPEEVRGQACSNFWALHRSRSITAVDETVPSMFKVCSEN
jgi:hypothetical protein